MITGLQHYGIYCKNIEDSIKFYCEVLGFRLVFTSEAMEGDKPLKMAFIKHDSGFCLELLEQADKSSFAATKISPNHIAFRTNDADATAEHLKKYNVAFECQPFTTAISFKQPLSDKDRDVFVKTGQEGLQVRIFFIRGPNDERIEIMADNLGEL
jgi:catechol 2,3-dioxygenase-like lactoylglutathione lyase family enzyme